VKVGCARGFLRGEGEGQVPSVPPIQETPTRVPVFPPSTISPTISWPRMRVSDEGRSPSKMWRSCGRLAGRGPEERGSGECKAGIFDYERLDLSGGWRCEDGAYLGLSGFLWDSLGDRLPTILS